MANIKKDYKIDNTNYIEKSIFLPYKGVYEEFAFSANEDNTKYPVQLFTKKSTNLKNDYFSVYAYGDLLKIVYHKVGRPVPKKQKNEIKKCPRSFDERFSSSISRAKSRIFELAICNEFNFFCTFTQNKEYRNRFDLSAFRKDLSQFLRNQNRGREEKIKYLLIPEEHKKGGWHMHGLLKGLTDDDLRLFSLSENIPLSIKKQLKRGEKVYDYTKYRKKFGFFTCTEIKDNIAVSKYITKYITKDFDISDRQKNGHLFFASQGLNGREIILQNCFDTCFIKEWDYENDFIKVKTIDTRNLS